MNKEEIVTRLKKLGYDELSFGFRKLSDDIEKENWKLVFGGVGRGKELPFFMEFHEQIPEEYKYEFFRVAYQNAQEGYNKISLEMFKQLIQCRKHSQDHLSEMKLLRKIINMHGLLDEENCISVYRGENNQSLDYKDAYSWTIVPKEAYKFAEYRGDKYRRVLQARILIDDVIDYIHSIGEYEILCFSENLKDVIEIDKREFTG